MGRNVVGVAVIGVTLLLAGLAPRAFAAGPSDGPLAFPGAQGWAAHTPGGRGGRIIRVTTLAADGPGSLLEALDATGPRIVVFEVGGAIDLGRREIAIKEPYLTVAGQTAPSPGITVIRGGFQIEAHDVIIQHLRVRVGEAGAEKKSGWETDALSTAGAEAHDIIVDHCTLTWATDENGSMSGKRFLGATPDEWRRNTSNRITYSNNILAEGLRYATHYKIEHSKGSLIHDNVNEILIIGNLYAHNFERNPLFKGGVRGVIVNNLVYDPGQRALHYNLMAEEWAGHPFEVGQMVAVGNVLRAGPSTPPKLAFLEIGGDGDLEYYGRDNVAVDQIGDPLPMFGRYANTAARILLVDKPPLWPAGLSPLPASDVQRSILHNVGARPWDRDINDVLLLADVAEGRGRIIDSEADLHGYPVFKPSHRPFNPADWDLSDMTPRTATALDGAAKSRGT